MPTFQIENRRTAVVLGIYDAETESDALAAMYRDAGYPAVSVAPDGTLEALPDFVDSDELIATAVHRLSRVLGATYSDAVAQAIEWGEYYPVVSVAPDGSVGTIEGVVGPEDDWSDLLLVDVQDGRVVRAGTGHESDAVAEREELLAAGLIDAEDR